MIGAGIPAAWVESTEGITVRRMPTWHGTLNYRLAMAGPATLRARLTGDVTVPPGRIILHSPLERPVRTATVNGRAATFTANTVTVDQFPAEVELH